MRRNSLFNLDDLKPVKRKADDSYDHLDGYRETLDTCKNSITQWMNERGWESDTSEKPDPANWHNKVLQNIDAILHTAFRDIYNRDFTNEQFAEATTKTLNDLFISIGVQPAGAAAAAQSCFNYAFIGSNHDEEKKPFATHSQYDFVSVVNQLKGPIAKPF